jgi:hemerythrin
MRRSRYHETLEASGLPSREADMQKTSEVIWQDTQHQMLFTLLDEIAEEQSSLSVLHQLKYYTESHFALEEKYMLLLEYPGYKEHLQAHDKFREQLVVMLKQPESYDNSSRQLISTFLTEWLKRHVFGIDKKLEDFIFASQAR